SGRTGISGFGFPQCGCGRGATYLPPFPLFRPVPAQRTRFGCTRVCACFVCAAEGGRSGLLRRSRRPVSAPFRKACPGKRLFVSADGILTGVAGAERVPPF